MKVVNINEWKQEKRPNINIRIVLIHDLGPLDVRIGILCTAESRIIFNG